MSPLKGNKGMGSLQMTLLFNTLKTREYTSKLILYLKIGLVISLLLILNQSNLLKPIKTLY